MKNFQKLQIFIVSLLVFWNIRQSPGFTPRPIQMYVWDFKFSPNFLDKMERFQQILVKSGNFFSLLLKIPILQWYLVKLFKIPVSLANSAPGPYPAASIISHHEVDLDPQKIVASDMYQRRFLNIQSFKIMLFFIKTYIRMCAVYSINKWICFV